MANEIRNYEALINSTDDLIWSVSADYTLIASNKAFRKELSRSLGIDIEQGDSLMLHSIIPEEFLLYWKTLYNRALSGETFIEETISPPALHYTNTWSEIRFNPIYDDVLVVGVACFSRNISERKNAEVRLRESEAHLAEAQRITKMGNWSFDFRTDKLIWSDELYHVLGTDKKTFIETHGSFLDHVIDEDRERVKQTSEQTQQTGEPFTIEYRILTTQGEERIIQEHGFGEKDSEEKVVRLYGTAQDVTERRQIELQIAESEEKYRTLFEQNLAGIYESTTKGIILSCNIAFAKMLKYESPSELVMSDAANLYFSKDDRTLFIENIIRQKRLTNYEGVLKCKDGSPLYFIENISVRVDTITREEIFTGIIVDITDSKLANKKIEESESRYRNLIEQATDAIFILSKDEHFDEINAAALQMLGYSKDELIHQSLKKVLFPADIEALKKRQPVVGETISYERKIKRKDGTTLELETNEKVLPDGSTIIFARDVTERNKAANANRFQAQLLNTIGQAVIATDLNGIINFWNKAAEVMHGWTAEEVIGKNVTEITSTDQSRDLSIAIMQQLNEGKPWSGEFTTKKKDGTIFPVFVTNVATFDEENNITGLIGVSTDITERAKQQHFLEVSEARYRRAQSLGKMGDWELDLKTNKLNWSDEIYRIFDIDKTTTPITFDLFVGSVHPEDLQGFLAAQNDLITGKSMLDFIHRIVMKDGTVCYVHELGKLECSENGEPICLTGTVQDVTQQKKSENRLKEAFEQSLLFASIVHSSNDAIVSKTLDGIITSWNHGAEIIFNYTAEEAIGQSIKIIIPPELYGEEDDLLSRVNNGEQVQYFKTERLSKNGMRIDVSLTISPIYNASGVIVGASKIARDITEEKKASQALTKMNAELHNLSAHLQEIREEERAHIAREIHDELGQQLAALKMNISWFVAHIPNNELLINEKVTDLLNLIGETVSSVRRISANLRPPILDDLGLIAAFEWHNAEIEKRSDIKIDCACNIPDVVLPENISIGLFRIYQEALTNVVRHSGAKNVHTIFIVTENKITLQVTDDGVGITPPSNGKKTFGLLGMKERVFIMNGDIDIQSKPGKGTTITVTIPHQNQGY